MAQYTVLNKVEIQQLVAAYDIENVDFYKVLSGGSENTNYLLKTLKASYVLTICEQKSVQDATELASLLEYLKRNNFSTSMLIATTAGELTTLWNNKPVMLKAFIEGTIIEELPSNLLVYLGQELAKLHQIKAPDFLPKQVAYGKERFDEVKVYAPESSFYTWLKEIQHYIEKTHQSRTAKGIDT